MNRRHALTLLGSTAALSACSRFATYHGPEVTRLEVYKSERLLAAFHHGEMLEVYDMNLGFAPTGHKTEYGDGRTPEGEYLIDRRNPNSEYYLSLGISYPNEADVAQARARGVNPGGDIFIHGTTWPFRGKEDWTAGCIAVTNREMRQLYAMVAVGTPITLYA
ncbi:MAG: L,D-transpeptidase family protein [Rhodobacteraceae bacterium]|nr:L,D-transpeptidase family protein [Paracoccaceae bacterium]